MPIDYPPEQLWPLYEKLPKDLQEAIFSEKTADAIYDICGRNNVKEQMSEIARYTGYVLLGLLPPDELEKTLKEEVGLEEKTAKQTNLEITRFILFPVKESLEALYKIEIERIPRPKEEIPTTTEEPGRDVYREPIE